ncbi:glycosyltransferase family 4 protein [Parvicella tangerina]|uniref:D-inositol-3-phosphate glycosyltransferase n=1 Tax=Parvicella tangerina TaxID=2829795 RepID=A0A916N9E5_9FLAO|nr:glycosyltransferase family 1 protein [Parvicella tangerina]CAG5076978.1 D-inositol-3-phosphate glycosyltransferase [Parvicella tangerina]
MRIGYDAKRAYQNYTGLGNYSRDLLKSVLDIAPENDYFLYTPKITKIPSVKFIGQHNNVTVTTPKNQVDKTFKGLWRSINLEKTLDQDHIDIFHGLSNEIPRKGSGSKIKYVVTIHDLIFKRYPRNYKAIDRRIYNTKFKYACKNSNRIIAISEQTKRDIVEFYGIPEEKIEVIYQTCHENFKKDYSNEIKIHIKEKFDLPDDFILNVGTIETRKNLYGLIQATLSMQNNLPIVVVGKKTKYYNFLKVQMQKLKIDPNRIIFLKNVSIEELPAIYQMANVFVYPSHFEGFGIPIIEALHSGVPVITSNGGCFSEAAGSKSKFIDPDDPEEIGEAIDLVLSDTNLREEMITSGKEYVKKFEPTILTDQLLNVYNNL